ncbi:MAG: DUF669 domain-containing protein [Pseudomonadota bacterium]
MADLTQYFESGFDDRAVEASTGVPEPIPPGEYMLQVEKSELTPTKDQSGIILAVTLTVAGGEYEGRKIFPRFNIRNKSMQAQTIGIGEFKALCAACGVDYEVARGNTDALNYVPFKALVGMEKESMNKETGQPYAPRNRVTKYIPAGGAAPAQTQTAAPATKPAAAVPASRPAAGGSLPWKKSA